MKLFRVDYIDGNTPVTYLTVGNDTDNEETIKRREIASFEKYDDLYCLGAKEIDEVDGYTITVK